MRIAVNLRQYYAGRIGGQENYLVNAIRALDQTGHQLTIFAQVSEFDAVRSFAPQAELAEAGQDGGAAILERIRRDPHDLLFCPLLVLEPLDPPIPSAVMIPDIQHEFYPQYFTPGTLEWRRHNFHPSVVNASVVLVPSAFTRQTIIERYGIPGDKIEAFPFDIDDEFRMPPDPAAQAAWRALKLPERYLYFPANYWKHKNHANVLKALKLLGESGFDDLHLVLTGAAGKDRDRVARAVWLHGLSKRVRMLDYQPRRVVPEIYRHARALVFATQFEGLGLPVLEAMQMRIPVVTSAGGASEEIAGGAAVLVDPLEPASIAEGVRKVLTDEGLRASLVERGARRVSGFSWERHNTRMLEIFHRISNAQPRRMYARVEEYPKISLVTPSFNMAPFIGDTIESVLSQRYPHLDYLVMDGGSTDGTQEILGKYEGRLRWRSEPDKGQADAVNKGYLATEGHVFSFLNADDTYRPGALAAVGEAFRRHPGASLVYGEAFLVDERSEILSRFLSSAFSYSALRDRCFICQPAAFVSRDAFARAGMLDTSLHMSLDHDLWIRLTAGAEVVKLPDYLANWRIHPGIKSLRSGSTGHHEALAVATKYFGYAPFAIVHAYACHLLHRDNQFSGALRENRLTHLLALYLGLKANPGQRSRFFREWGSHTGFNAAFEGRWQDGWVSKRYRGPLLVDKDAVRLRIEGRHAPMLLFPLTMKVKADETELGAFTITRRGCFRACFDLPAELRGREVALQLDFDRVWQLAPNNYRRLSCIVDVIALDPAREAQ